MLIGSHVFVSYDDGAKGVSAPHGNPLPLARADSWEIESATYVPHAARCSDMFRVTRRHVGACDRQLAFEEFNATYA